MHRLFDVRLTNQAFGDPGLFVDLREAHRALLFDIGDIATLPPRKLMRLSHVFVTHAHMDHFSGFDALLRVVLGRKDRVVLHGGPGFVGQVEHKLRAYTWNVVQRYEMPLVIEAREASPGNGQGVPGAQRCARFDSRSGFAREDGDPVDRERGLREAPPRAAHDDAPRDAACDAALPDVVHDEALLRVRARFVDHGTPCLAYALEEKARVRLARDRLAALGFGVGAWLRTLKDAVLAGAPAHTPIDVRWRDRDGDHVRTRSLGELAHLVLDVLPGQRVGYVTDLRYTEANVAALAALLHRVDVLYIECVFLEADAAHGARKHHLTARQAGEIAGRIGAKAVVPFHFSPRYEGRESQLEAELRTAWEAARTAVPAPPGAAS
jgi:ribonuclease Z